MARVTLITPYFWPEVAANVPLMTNLAEDLAEAGHAVTIVTSTPNRNVDENTRRLYSSGRRHQELYHGCPVIRFPNPFSNRKGSLNKIAEGLTFVLWVAYAVLKLRRHTDVYFVYSNPPLLALPVSVLGGRRPVIFNLQDLFPDSAVAAGLLSGDSGITKLLRSLEKATYRRCSVIAAISPLFTEHVHKLVPEARVEVLPNWIDTDQIRQVDPRDNTFRASLGLKDEFVILYAGNIGFSQNLDVVVDAAALLRSHEGIRFVLVGDGQYKRRIEARVRSLDLTNVLMAPIQPQNLVPQVYSTGDVGLVAVRSGQEKTSVPSKTWTIMACSRAVVACIGEDSYLARLLTEEEIGLVVSPEDPRQLADAVLKLRSEPETLRKLSLRGRAYVEANLSRRSVTSRYVHLVEELSSRHA